MVEYKDLHIRNLKCWDIAKKLHTVYICAHGINPKNKWDQINQWEKEYWYSIAEFVLDNKEMIYGS